MEKIRKFAVFFAILLCAFVAGPSPSTTSAAELNAGALVLVNSRSPGYKDFAPYLEPYLIQFGVPYEVRDIAQGGAEPDFANYALIIIGHRAFDVPRTFFTQEQERKLLAAVAGGAGLVSLDGLLIAWADRRPHVLYGYASELFALGLTAPAQAATITIGVPTANAADAPTSHYITSLGPVPRTVRLKRAILISGLVAGPGVSVLARCGSQPLLMTARHGSGRTAVWTSYEWTRPDVKGKLYGLDDLVWRSLVWAARKPFVMRGMPHYLALRIDDVSGVGLGANRHLGYVETANHYGLKPWLGVFLDDLRENPEAVQTLAKLTQQGLATASVHARRWANFFYLDEPLWHDERGANIAGHDWPEDQVSNNFADAGRFFQDHGIPKSKVVIPHNYEFGSNVFSGLEQWGAEFVSTPVAPGKGYGSETLRAAPYLKPEYPFASNGNDPIYIADWLEVPGHAEFDHKFFNFLEEVRDVAGYEWAPSGVPVQEAIRRGLVECQREFDSMLPAVLFTHESDHIRHIQPADWDEILKGVMDGLKPYQPVPVTLDFLSQYLRALLTSRLKAARYDVESGDGSVEFEGFSDLPTEFYIFEQTGQDMVARQWEAPAFQGTRSVRWRGYMLPHRF
jgi:hypothetical protein